MSLVPDQALPPSRCFGMTLWVLTRPWLPVLKQSHFPWSERILPIAGLKIMEIQSVLYCTCTVYNPLFKKEWRKIAGGGRNNLEVENFKCYSRTEYVLRAWDLIELESRCIRIRSTRSLNQWDIIWSNGRGNRRAMTSQEQELREHQEGRNALEHGLHNTLNTPKV